MAIPSTALLPADHFIKTHQFTPTVHRDIYSSIDPLSTSLSQRGKTVIITGASQGIGKAIALAFAKAGVAKIILAARNIEKLEETKREVLSFNGDVEVLVFPTDTTSQESVEKLEHKAKAWCGVPDVLVNAAGLWSSTTSLAESNPEEWWADFEVNVKGTYLLTRSFLRLLGPSHPGTIINVGSWGMLMTAPNGSSYCISKLALARLSEAIPSEYSNVRSMNFHPGMIKTDMADAHPEVLPFCGDTSELAAGTAVYLASPQAEFLSGRYMSANWDVDELAAMKEQVTEKDLLKLDLKGSFGSSLFNSTVTSSPDSSPFISTSTSVATTTIYPAHTSATFNLKHFLEVHMPLAMRSWKMYGMKGYEVTKFDASISVGTEALWSHKLVIFWEGEGDLERALGSPEAREVFDDVPNFTNKEGFGVFMNGTVVGRG